MWTLLAITTTITSIDSFAEFNSCLEAMRTVGDVLEHILSINPSPTYLLCLRLS